MAPGDRTIYTRFAGYVPREEPANGLAGGKVAKIDRIDFHVIPDAATKSGALQTGEVDFIDQLQFDQAEVLAKRPGCTVCDAVEDLQSILLRPNALVSAVRQREGTAGAGAGGQPAEYMRSRSCGRNGASRVRSFFVCGSPNGITAGAEPYANPDLTRARQLLKESGYKGEPMTLMSSHETLFVGMAADYAAKNSRRSA